MGDGDDPFTKVDRSNAKSHNEKNRQSQQAPAGERPDGSGNQVSRENQGDHQNRRRELQKNSAKNIGDRNQRAEHRVSSATNNGNQNRRSRSSTYRRYTVLLIHDDNFDKFNPQSFTSQFNVHQFKVASLEDLEKKKRLLNEKLKKLKPDCVYIHLGINDLLKRKCIPSGSIHDLASFLLDNCEAQICFSLLIPTANDNTMNQRIIAVNNEMRSNVSWFHKNNESARSRIFTYNNDQVGNLNSYSINTGFDLKDRGEKLLYLRLREGLKKTLRIPRQRSGANRNQRNRSNRFSDE